LKDHIDGVKDFIDKGDGEKWRLKSF
jgi:hypothetical protein